LAKVQPKEFLQLENVGFNQNYLKFFLAILKKKSQYFQMPERQPR